METPPRPSGSAGRPPSLPLKGHQQQHEQKLLSKARVQHRQPRSEISHQTGRGNRPGREGFPLTPQVLTCDTMEDTQEAAPRALWQALKAWCCPAGTAGTRFSRPWLGTQLAHPKLRVPQCRAGRGVPAASSPAQPPGQGWGHTLQGSHFTSPAWCPLWALLAHPQPDLLQWLPCTREGQSPPERPPALASTVPYSCVFPTADETTLGSP